MDSGNTQTIRERLLAAAVEQDGKTTISCSDALALAAELGVTPAEVGTVCDDNKVKIRACQLGCF